MKKIITIIVLFAALKSAAQKTLYTEDTLAQNQVFKQRVKSATVNAANQVAADTSQVDYVQKYANVIVASPESGWLLGMSYAVVANPVIVYESIDGDIQYAVNSNFEKSARAYYNIVIPINDSTGFARESEKVRRFLNRKMNISEK